MSIHRLLRPVGLLALAAFLCLRSEVLAQRTVSGAYNPDAVYLQAYMLMLDAEKLENQKNYAGAYYKYQDASNLFDSVARTSPDWQPQIVNVRRGLIRRKLEEVRALERERRTSGSADAPPSALPAASGAAVEVLPGIPAQNHGGTGASPIDSKLADYQTQLNQRQNRVEDLQKSLEQKTAELFKVKNELNDSLRAQLDLKSKLETASTKGDRQKSELEKQVKQLTEALQQATRVQEEAKQKIDSLVAELSTANTTIRQLNREKEDLIAERGQLMALVNGRDDTKGAADRLIEQNRQLKAQLDAANEKIAGLSKDKDAAQKEAAQLRDQLGKVREELAATQKENQTFRQQIAGLRQRLEETNASLVQMAPTMKSDSELGEENKLLRKMLLDQLSQQSYREQKKKLALEQIAKMQIDSDELLTAINDMAAPPAALSPEEKSLLEQPGLKQFLDGKGISSTLLTRPGEASSGAASGSADAGAPDGVRPPSPVPPAPLSADLQILADAGKAAFQRGRLTEAERSFKTWLENDPLNTAALSNLAAVQIKQNRYSDSRKTLEKLLAVQDRADDYALYLLGLSYYKQKSYEEAEKTLIQAVQQNPSNARAFYVLGMVANKKGELENAKAAFLEAVDKDPAYGDAHMNLARIYAFQKETDKAVRHYGRAIEAGAQRDTELERKMGTARNSGEPPLPVEQ